MKKFDIKKFPNLPENLYRELWKLSVEAIGRTALNPAVACIITYKDHIITGGSTEPPGSRHAEIVALDNLQKIVSIKKNTHVWKGKLTLIVTLEPCSTYGRTLPCVLRIQQFRDWFKHIIIEHNDPYLYRTGIRYLWEYRFDISKEIIFQSPHFALHSFFSIVEKKKPQYMIKIATDPAGFMGISSHRISITGTTGKFFTMLLRAKADAVLVGPGTTAIDQPSLHIRDIIDGVDFLSYKIQQISEETKILYHNGLGYDEFLRGILIYYRQILANLRKFSYQPIRLFILGRYFPKFFSFYSRQIQIREKTEKNFYLLIPRKYQDQYNWNQIEKGTYIITPDLEEPDFFSFLNEFLISLEVQKILIESGPALFSYLYSYINENDYIYWVRNSKLISKTLDFSYVSRKSFKYWNYSDYHLILKDQVQLEDIGIFSLRKSMVSS